MDYIASSEIEARLDWVLASPADAGRVESLVVRPAVNQREPLQRVMFSPEHGVEGHEYYFLISDKGREGGNH